MRQVLSWAFARSPGERSLACALLASFWDCGLFFPLYYSRGFTLSGRPGGLSSSPAVVPGYVQ